MGVALPKKYQEDLAAVVAVTSMKARKDWDR